MYFITGVLLLVLGACSSYAQVSSGPLPTIDMDERVVLDKIGDYVLLLKRLAEEVIMEVQVATEGYVGLGFSSNGHMTGADIFMGWIDGNGRIYAQDRHALGDAVPIVDSSQDYNLLGGYKNGTHTVLRFSRPFKTADLKQDYSLKGNPYEVIWAYGRDLILSPNQNLLYHGKKPYRGHRKMDLLYNGANHVAQPTILVLLAAMVNILKY